MAEKLKVLILAGGDSEEREVSLDSARAVTDSMIRLGLNVSAIDAASGDSLLDDTGQFILKFDNNPSSKITHKANDRQALSKSLALNDHKDCDLVFIALHGGAGEDGTIQRFLDLIGMRYTGSGQLASTLAMNKAKTKNILRNEGIPTPDWILLKLGQNEKTDQLLQNTNINISYPLIVKPNNSGSTIGLTLVKKSENLLNAVQSAREISDEILIEQYINGREITCSVLDGQPLPLVEIIPTGELYDYQAKYTKGQSRYICPAEVPENVTIEIQEYAARVFKIIDCRGLVRADFLLDERNRPFFLEVNTLPGLTELSLAPMAAAKAGISFDRLIEKICQSAL